MVSAAMRPVHLPNLISLARLVLAPLTVWLIMIGQAEPAFWLLLVAGASDAVDGALARWLKARSLLGSYLDPIADKALLIGVFCALGYQTVLPLWLVVLVVSRDLFLLGGVLLLQMLRPGAGTIQPVLISKANTAAQILLAMLALGVTGFELDVGWLVRVLVWAVAFTTIGSWVHYGIQAARRLVSIGAAT
jgi:cardiolipin synthase (CMP-forming)